MYPWRGDARDEPAILDTVGNAMLIIASTSACMPRSGGRALGGGKGAVVYAVGGTAAY